MSLPPLNSRKVGKPEGPTQPANSILLARWVKSALCPIVVGFPGFSGFLGCEGLLDFRGGQILSARLAVSRSWSVAGRTVTLTVSRPTPGAGMCANVEWSPCEPNSLTREELALYRLHRDEAIAAIAIELGVRAAVLDL